MKSSMRSFAIGVLTFALATTISTSNGMAQTNATYAVNLAAATALVVDDSITKASQLAGKTIAINAKSTGRCRALPHGVRARLQLHSRPEKTESRTNAAARCQTGHACLGECRSRHSKMKM
jgi:hypothetical protein